MNIMMDYDKLAKIDWHTLSKDKVLDALKTNDKRGLTSKEAAHRLDIFGPNSIREERRKSKIAILAKQFKDPLILILLVATTISGFVGELIDAIVIVAIIILATIVGFVQEYKSEKAIEALKRMAAATCRVIRDGEEKLIEVGELVPGDVIHVSAGDRISADAYIIESFNLEANEAPLTGESVPVRKMGGISTRETPIAERENILYTITTVTHGRGKAIVFATGMHTELGKIARAVQHVEVQKTPFEIRMNHTSKLLSVIMLAVVGIIGLISIIRGHQIIEMLIWSISLAVAAVPEALPAVTAASLSLGMYQMAKKNAIIRRLPAVETLGSTTVICSDKTGTLTKGEMTVRKIYVYDKFAQITGTGYNLDGSLINSEITREDIELLAKTAALCNDAGIKEDISKGELQVIGDPTEIALLVFARKVGLEKEKAESELPRIQEVSFTSERKMMTTIHKADDNKFEVYTKGAVEEILSHCNTVVNANLITIPIDDYIKDKILLANNEMASTGLRVLAFAFREKVLTGDNIIPSGKDVETRLTFLGIAGMIDPARLEVVDAIAECKTAGIDVVMITGDNKLTAFAVGEEIGIVSGKIDVTARKAVTGTELDAMDSAELAEQVEQIKIYSRVSPEHKLKIVQALKKRGHVVAMTGDGTNDAPALKAADIGIAMGITGTQVAKESSSMILADDNFANIVSAVKEGRRIFDNVKKYLVYLLTTNIGEIIILAFSVIAGWPFPLLAKHILYINLATDGSPAIALGLEPYEPDIMKRKPKSPKDSQFSDIKKWLIGIPILLAVTSLSLLGYVLEVNGWQSEMAIAKARTMTFGLIVFFELFFSLSCRSFIHNINNLGLVSNKMLIYSLIGESSLMLFIMNYPFMQHIFELVPLNITEWSMMLLLATTGFIFSELLKILPKPRR